MKNALRNLLNELDSIAEEHEEIIDTDVRENMGDALHHAYLEPTAGYALPDDYEMEQPEGNAAIKAALMKFVAAAKAESPSLATREARLAAFQDLEVESEAGNTYDEYFGHEGDDEDDDE